MLIDKVGKYVNNSGSYACIWRQFFRPLPQPYIKEQRGIMEYNRVWTTENCHLAMEPGRLAQSGASRTANQGTAGSSPGPATYFRGVYQEIISTVNLPLPLIQEGQMSVCGESVCTKYWSIA